MSELPLYFLQIFSSLETFALQREQTLEVKIVFDVSMALIAVLIVKF